jgi:phosphate transport system substrate-binding protein
MKRFLVGVTAAAVAACGGNGAQDGQASGLSGRITADGSSTVFPVTEAVAEEFMAGAGQGVQVTVASSGTGGGFKRFCAGETDVTNASRPIKDEEKALCARNGVEFVELPVATDGLVVVVNSANRFVQCLTVDELKKVWQPASTVRTWADVRAGFPATPIKLYGPGTNSGTFDYFTAEIVGEEDASRSDYTASEDDNVLVQGVAGDAGSLGYFGYAYFAENRQQLRALGVDGGQGCIEPNPQTIESGQYAPLSRPLLIYVKKASLQRAEVREFVSFYLQSAPELSAQVGYVPLSAAGYQQATQTFQQAAGGGA